MIAVCPLATHITFYKLLQAVAHHVQLKLPLTKVGPVDHTC